MTRNVLAILAVLLSPALGASGARAAIQTIDFDDLNHAPYDDGHLVGAGYHGFTWNNIGVVNAQKWPGFGSALGDAMTSKPMVAYNWPGQVSFSSSKQFTFLGGEFTALWRKDMLVTLIGLRQGSLMYSTGFTPVMGSPLAKVLNWSGIDTVKIVVQGGVWGGLAGDGEQIGIDDLRVDVAAVPLPAALPLFLVATGGLGALAHRRRRGTGLERRPRGGQC
jgi:hypothetical protein